MADNVTADAGAGGATFAADDIGGVHFPRTKLIIGADGVNDGDVASGNPLPIGVVTFPTSVVTTATLDAPAEAATITLVSGMNAVGIDVSGTWDGQLEFEASVDGTAYESHDILRNSTEAAVNATTTNGIFLSSLASFKNFRVRASSLNSGAAVVTLRTSHGTEVVHIENDVTITGTVTVGSHAVTNAGTFVVQESGAALTALQLIDDAVFADDAPFTHATSKVVVLGGTYQSSPNTLDDNDAGSILLDASHRLVPAPSAAQYVDDADWTATTSSLVVIGGVHDAADTTRTPTAGDVAGISLDPNANQRVVLPTLRKINGGIFTVAASAAYAINDGVSDNATAGSVTKLSFTIPKSAGTITRVRVKYSDQAEAEAVTLRLWLWDTTFTVNSGDSAAFSNPMTNAIGYVDVALSGTGSSDVQIGFADCSIAVTTGTVFGLFQSLTAWTSAGSKTLDTDIWVYPG